MICVTSRPHYQTEVEEILEVPSFLIREFDDTDKIECLLLYWENSLKIVRNSNINRFAEKCLSSLEESVTNIPMLCALFAEINQESVLENLEYLADSPEQTMGEMLVQNLETLLYMHVVRLRFKKVHVDDLPDVINVHYLAAIKLLFPDWVESLQSYLPTKFTETSPEIYDVGIIEKQEDEGSRFQHRSFAEYMVADFLATANLPETGNTEPFIEFFFKRVLCVAEESTFILSYLFLDDALTTVQTFKFIYPRICNFIDGLLETSEIIEISPICSAQLQQFYNTTIFLETIQACVFGSFEYLLKFISRSYIEEDKEIFKDQLSDDNSTLRSLLLVATKFANSNILDILVKLFPTKLLYANKSVNEISDCNFSDNKSCHNIFHINQLHVAAERGNYDLFEKSHKMLQQNEIPYSTSLLLHVCVNDSMFDTTGVLNEKIQIIEFICEIMQKEDLINEKDDMDGRSPMLMQDVHINILVRLLDLGADTSIRTTGLDNNILHKVYSTIYDTSDYDKLLTHPKLSLILPSLLLQKNKLGLNPLHLAVTNLGISAFHILESLQNVDFNALDSDGNTILDLAIKYERRLDILEFIVRMGGKTVNAVQDGNEIHYAVLHDNLEAVMFFEEQGVSVDAKNSAGLTPLELASNLSKPLCLDYLGRNLSKNAPLSGVSTGEKLDVVAETSPVLLGIDGTRTQLNFYGNNFRKSVRAKEKEAESRGEPPL